MTWKCLSEIPILQDAEHHLLLKPLTPSITKSSLPNLESLQYDRVTDLGTYWWALHVHLSSCALWEMLLEIYKPCSYMDRWTSAQTLKDRQTDCFSAESIRKLASLRL